MLLPRLIAVIVAGKERHAGGMMSQLEDVVIINATGNQQLFASKEGKIAFQELADWGLGRWHGECLLDKAGCGAGIIHQSAALDI